ncbi:MAG: hypothetical protein B7Z59_05790 [Acidiphilium sp. 37-67-22]|nr:MAG: hypothetical protein B7Z59_05790 [Acidiphilium sp. 37-67-22]
MNCCSPSPNSNPTSHQSGLSRWRSRLMGRTGIVLGLIAIGGGALAFGGGWGKLVAIGVAPIILSILPCLVMCGLGFCMMGMCKNKSHPPTQPFGQNNFREGNRYMMQGNSLESTPQTTPYAQKPFSKS